MIIYIPVYIYILPCSSFSFLLQISAVSKRVVTILFLEQYTN